ncbi:hypothetical protein [Pseudodesulfovibrio mercurii]|uniref:hypothetical protein n=1 Tax=Pseudodesulfovibrio mercurii TaxID=641491 RepID=UPI0002F17D34|nr:hypothetical protein [Pseudodesulfovibrio mercurii]
MQRLFLPLACAALFVVAAWGTYLIMGMVEAPSTPVEVAMPPERSAPEPPVVPSDGEVFKVLPFPAKTGVGVDVELDRELTVRPGELLLSGAVEVLYPVLRPVRAMDLVLPLGAPVGRLDPDVGWAVYFMLRDDTFLAEVPRPMVPAGRRLGLRVDHTGRVVGGRPWFDLDAGTRLDEAWTGGERGLFVTGAGVLPVVRTRFEERYREARCDDKGVCGGTIAFSEYEPGKDEPVSGSVVILDGGDTINVYGLVIDPVEFTPDELRYVVRKRR